MWDLIKLLFVVIIVISMWMALPIIAAILGTIASVVILDFILKESKNGN